MSAEGIARKVHKYIARIRGPKGNWRYFYTKAAVAAYANKKKKSTSRPKQQHMSETEKLRQSVVNSGVQYVLGQYTKKKEKDKKTSGGSRHTGGSF